MTALQIAAENREALTSLSALQLDEIYRYLDTIIDDDFQTWTRKARPVILELSNQATNQAGEFQAYYYNRMREYAGVTGAYNAVNSTNIAAIEELKNGIGYSFTVWEETMDTAERALPYSKVKSLIGGQVTGAIFQQGRIVNTANVVRDLKATTMQLVASPRACAWCKTRSALSFLNNTSVTEKTFKGFHQYCRCSYQPVFGDSLPVSGYAQSFTNSFAELYSSGAVSGSKSAYDLSKLAIEKLGW